MSRLFFLLVCFIIPFRMSGQQSTSEGILKDTELLIKKDRQHLLPEASRLFESAPTSPWIGPSPKPLEYNLLDLCPTFDLLPRKIKILRAKHDKLTKLYGDYLQGGFRNLYTPFLEGYFANKYHSKYAYGLQMKYLPDRKEAYFKANHALIQLYGKLFTKTLRWEGEMSYNRDEYQSYYPKDSRAARILHQFMARESFANYVYDTFHYQFDSFFYYTHTSLARETQWQFNGKGEYALDDAWMLKAFTDLYLTNHDDDAITIYRKLWRFKPILFFTFHSFDIQGGINLVYQDDVSYSPNFLNIYPVWEVKYALRRWLQPYLGINGDIQQNFFRDLSQESPFLASKVDLHHTNRQFEFYGGARGDVVAQLNWHAGFSLGAYKNFHCLVNNAQEHDLFDICYDPAAKLFNILGELTHTNRAKTLTTQIRGNYFHYTLQKLPKPWHRPQYQLDLLSTYRFYDKIVCRGAIHWMGGIEAQDVVTKAPIRLEDIFDVNLGIEYLWNSRFSIFLDFQNLLFRNNVRYLYNSPRDFQYMLGLTYAW